jgi:hypothetical protein
MVERFFTPYLICIGAFVLKYDTNKQEIASNTTYFMNKGKYTERKIAQSAGIPLV